MNLPPLKSLRFFLAAAQTGSFKAAAEQLHVTQGAVSQQIRLLEEQLQTQLFERQTRQTLLTAQGQLLLPYIAQGFEHLEQGIIALKGDPRPSILRITTLHSFASNWLIPRLPEFQALYPDIMVQLAPSNDVVDFQQTEMDLAIRMGAGGYQPFLEEKIMADEMVLVASPACIAGIDASDPAQVFALPWLEDDSPGMHIMIDNCCRYFAIARQTLVPTIKANNAVPLIQSALEGRGIMLNNRSLMEDHIRSGKLLLLLDYCAPSPHSLYLVGPPQHFQWPKVQQFKQWFLPKVRAHFAKALPS